MPKYMVVVKSESGTNAFFFDDFNKAEDFRMNSTVSMGWEAELYKRIVGEEDIEAYEFLYS